MVIYIDVLFLINLYVTYFELLSVCILTHKNIAGIRMIISAVVGGLFSFVIFLPEDSVLITSLLKIASCIIISVISMGYGDFYSFFKNTVFLLLVNFIFAGLMLCLWLFVAPLDMFYSNGAVYFDIDGLTIILSTTMAYFIIRIVRFIFDKNGKTDKKYIIEVHNNGAEVRLFAFPDTGNGLVDYFSGMPVVICRKEKCLSIMPDVLKKTTDNDSGAMTGIRLLPVSTVAGDGIVYAFKVEKVVVFNRDKRHTVNALIGIMEKSHQEYDAIFNPKLLI